MQHNDYSDLHKVKQLMFKPVDEWLTEIYCTWAIDLGELT